MNSPVIEKTDKTSVRLWLYTLALLITIIVLVGGATRLTDSGLSITEWAPISGVFPPLSLADWESEFIKYQTTDEFKFQNSAMTLAQFETIYWWEWGHRILGRFIGLFVLLPMVYFWIQGRFDNRLKKASIGLFLLVCLQGAIGWWMVKSGLVNRVDVSQIRLAVHLVTACIFLVATVWVARSLAVHTAPPAHDVYWQGGALVVLILVQIFLGGLVAGLDAGMAYNTWPLMNGELVPQGMFVATPVWHNFTDNALTVQFIHRVSAYLLLAAILWHVIYLFRQNLSPPHVNRAGVLLALVLVQAGTGIVTLVMQVPTSWALIHQLGGIVVLAFATAHWRALRPYEDSASIAGTNPVNAAYGAH